MALLFKSYHIPMNDRSDIEFLLEKEPLSKKNKNSINVKTHFFHNKITVDINDNGFWVRSKLTPNFALIIPYASLLIIIYLITKSANFYLVETIGILVTTILTNYFLFLYLTESSHNKIQNYIFMNLYKYSYKKYIENDSTAEIEI